MKVFIMAYARKNFGDDLFVKMLLDKYKKVDFFMKVNNYEFLKELDKYENLHVLNGDDTDEKLNKMKVEEYDAYVYIGGSIFMEGGKVYNLSPKFYDFVKRCKKKNIPFCYISSNYGPYQTQEYFDLSRENFKTCTDICFRDKYSYNLFKDIKSVRYAPDFAFSYKMPNTSKIPNSIGISLINLDIRKKLEKVKDDYYNCLVNNIKQYIENGNTVYLYSFCEHEKDEVTVDRLLEEFNHNPKIVGVKYDGNVDKFLETYGKMEYMICARFHAMVLSCVARQKIYVMSYSNKIDNVIEDLKLDLPILQLKNISKDIVINKEDFASVEEEKILNIIEKSKDQDKVFEQVCNKGTSK